MRINSSNTGTILAASLAALASLAACSSEGTNPGTPEVDAAVEVDGGLLQPPARGFQIVSAEVTIDPGVEITYCYYFRTPNTEPLVIKKWESAMTPGSHHMILFTTPNDVQPPGTVSSDACGFGGATANLPVWQYAAQTPTASVTLPGDDGTGKPLGQEIAANTAGFLQMHYLNTTDAPITANVTLNAEAYEAGVAYTKTAAYITYNNNISIPAGATNHVEEMTCTVPDGAQFWMVSTHAHQRAIKTEVINGMPASTEVAFQSDDWEHPGAATWMAAPFYEFASDKLTYRCTYNNPGSMEVNSGDSAATDEMCMATGYYFPATKPLICFNNLGPF